MKNMKTLWKLACHVIFWSWHGVYLAFLAFGLAPYVLWPVLKMTVAGEIPWSISATGFAISLLPLASLALGWRRLRQTPEGLFGLFYGAFAPAMVLLLMRLFMVRQLTDGAAHVLIGVGLGMCAWLAQLLWGLRDKPAGVEVLRMLGHAQLLVAGLYAAALLAFFALPMAGSFVLHGIPAIAEGLWEVFLDIPEVVAWFFRSIPGWVSDLFRFEWVEALLAIPLTALVAIPGFVLWVLLFCWSLTLFVMMPLALIVVFVGSWRQALAHFAGRLGRSLGLALTLGVVVANVAVFVHANQQHQQAAFEALKQKPRSDAERLALLEDAAQLREGLLNAYLAPWRYLGSTGSNGSVRDFWMNTFWMERDSAQGVQDAFNALAKPLVFEGSSLQKDSDEAAELWPQFFDSPLQEAEREAVLEAITTTWDADEVEAGLLNVGQRKVHLDRQEIELIEHGGYAEVVIHEVYRNQTPDQQEIFYLFNLPRSAAVTSLSLGATDDRSLAFDHVVAPRGAAQAVYIAERDKRVDPALLEQVGPRQYRLRAFPIPPVQSEGAEAPAFHLWLSYTALAQGDAWPMPALAEARNIYWDDDTERTINGERAPDSEEWTPPLIDASAPQPRTALVARVDDQTLVRATPVGDEWGAPLRGERYAVVLDTSYSMGAHADEAAASLEWIREQIAPDNEVDLYLAHSPFSGLKPERVALDGYRPDQQIYFGGHTFAHVLDQLLEIREGRDYDAVVVITDEGSAALVGDRPAPEVGAPLWMVHLGGLPATYDDGTLGAIQGSGGGVEERVQAVFQRRSLLRSLGEDAVDVADGYTWEVLDGQAGGAAPAESFAPLAARIYALHLTRAVDREDASQLDRLHAVAVRYSVVTPYSSMIVLVNEAQLEALRKASEAEDRFDRESESGVEELTKPHSPMEVSGAPEPEEWILILLACGMLLQVARRRQLAVL